MTILVSLLLASACQRSSIPSSPGPLPTAAVTQPAASATPALAATIRELRLIPASDAGRWRLVGMIQNDSAFGAQEMVLEAAVVDAAGRSQGTRPFAPPLSDLQPGESMPFETFLDGVSPTSRVSVHVLSYAPGAPSDGSAQITGLQAVPTSDGGLAVFGRIRATGSRPVLLKGLAIALRDPGSKELLGVAQRAAGVTRLEPGASEPFLAIAQDLSATAALEAYVDLAAAPPLATVLPSLPTEPTLAWTDQGKLFVVGQVKNPSPATMMTALQVRLQADGVVMGLADVTFDVPLGPGEVRPFCVEEFPGMQARLQGAGLDSASLVLDVRVDAGRSARVPHGPEPLTVQVTGFENIGSRLVLRGQIQNPGEVPVRATVLASARSTEGEPLTAASLTLGEDLGAGQVTTFVMTMPWPRDTQAAMSEFDVRAFALAP